MPPRLTASVASLTESMNALPASRPPFTPKEKTAPGPAICRSMSACCGWLGRPGWRTHATPGCASRKRAISRAFACARSIRRPSVLTPLRTSHAWCGSIVPPKTMCTLRSRSRRAGAPALLDRLRKVHIVFGGTMDPHQAWLVLRGVKTLGLRMERAQANALEIARFLEAHPGVAWVLHPGLPSHPQHALMLRQMAGPGAVFSFRVKGGLEAGKAFIDSVRLATLLSLIHI